MPRRNQIKTNSQTSAVMSTSKAKPKSDKQDGGDLKDINEKDGFDEKSAGDKGLKEGSKVADKSLERVKDALDGSLQSQKKTEEAGIEVNPKNPQSSPYYALICLIVPIAIAVILSHLVMPTHDTVQNIQLDLDQLFQDFKNQPPRSARKLKSRVLPYLNHATSPQPFVLLIAAKHEDRLAAECFANRVGRLLVSDPVIINGSLYADVKSDKAKEDIDAKLRKAFEKGYFPTAAVIHDLESIPYSTSELFYAYCDHDNPRYKEATIIFTVVLPEGYDLMSPTSDEVQKEGVIETYLSKDSPWAKDENFDENIMGALLSRITDTVIVMSGESIESLKCKC